MKLLLLRVLLQRRAKDEGFTLPVVIALGLIMILLGAVNIMTAGEENLNVISDNQKKKATAVADIALSRYRQILDRNRMLMVYDNDDWSDVDYTCDVKSDIAIYADPTKWQKVSTSEDLGEYRIVSYIYDIDGYLNDSTDTLSGNDDDGLFAPNDDNLNLEDIHTFNGRDEDGDGNPDLVDIDGDGNLEPPVYEPKGILTIQSKATDGSKTQIQAEIPIRINEDDMTNIAPALWIGNSDINPSIFDNVVIDGDRDRVSDTNDPDTDDGNIVISKPASGNDKGCNIDDSLPSFFNNNQIIYDPRPLPSIIPAPSGDLVRASSINDNDISSDIDLSPDRYVTVRGENNQLEPMLLLGAVEAAPRSNHKIWFTNDNGIDFFYYSAPSGISIDDGEKLAVDGNSRAIIYVNGDIDLNGNASLQAGSNSSTSFRSTGLQVYLASGNNITINPGAGNTVVIKGLIHAPDSTVNITGAGTVRIEGAMWVKDLVNTGNADIVIIPDDAPSNTGKAYQHYIGTDLRAAKPITDAVTEWEIQAVEDLPATTTSGTEGEEE